MEAGINIEQFQLSDTVGEVRDFAGELSAEGTVRDTVPLSEGTMDMRHVPHVSNPVSGGPGGGFATSDSEQWSDSPTNQPLLLYRHRFSWGRDCQELFPTNCGDSLELGEDGQQWGALDNDSGQVIYQHEFALSNEGTVIRQIRHSGQGTIQTASNYISSESPYVKQLGVVDADTTVVQFPFLLLASPVPWSRKNAVDTDVYVRFANYTYLLDVDSFVLYIDDVLKTPLQVVPFVGGLGGFDVTWLNDMEFEYDTWVKVRWEFSDTASPANDFVMEYLFYTVPDLAKPRVTNIVPAHGSTSVAVTGSIQFDVVDFESGINIGSLSLYVNNVLAVDGENGTMTVVANEVGTGYTVNFVPSVPWLYGDLIPVAIFVSDASIHANELFYTYSFTTISSTPPVLLSYTPAPCSTSIVTGTDVSVDVVDGGHGLKRDSIILVLDDVHKDTAKLFPIVFRDE